MLNRRLITLGVLAVLVSTLLIICISLHYLRGSEGHYGAILYTSSRSSAVRFPKSNLYDDSRLPLMIESQPAPNKLQAAPVPWNGGTKGYLLALYVLEQLTMSSAHYISLLNIANSWRLSGVEPTICRSRMYGLPGISGVCHETNYYGNTTDSESWPQVNREELKYGRLYNLSYLNQRLVKCFNVSNSVRNLTRDQQTCLQNSRVVESLEEFVRLSYRRIVLVHFVRGIGGSSSRTTFLPQDEMRYFERAVLQAQVQKPIMDCSHEARNYGIANAVENVLNKFVATSDSVFLVQRVICVNRDLAKNGVNVTRLRDSIFRLKPNISVVFTKWQNRGIFNSADFDTCKVSPIPHSDEVVKGSKRFLSKMNIKKPFIAVHLRLERLYQCEALIPGYMNCCVERLSALLGKIEAVHNINSTDVFIIKDYGPYGSDSCTYKLKYINISICLNLTKVFFSQLERHGYHASEFIPSKYNRGTPDNSGFVSLVEAGSLLSGSVLVAGGFGSYQGTVIKQFLGVDDPNVGNKHFDNRHKFGSSSLYDRVYRVCTCTPLKGHLEKLNGIELRSHSCDSNYRV